MANESILLAILAVLTLILILIGIAIIFLVKAMRAQRAEQQAIRRVVSNMDWSSAFSNMQSHGKESVRILDIIDKRLQKLEALEKVQLTQTNPNFRA